METGILIAFGLAGFAVNISIIIRSCLKIENRLTALETRQSYLSEQLKRINAQLSIHNKVVPKNVIQRS